MGVLLSSGRVRSAELIGAAATIRERLWIAVGVNPAITLPPNQETLAASW